MGPSTLRAIAASDAVPERTRARVRHLVRRPRSAGEPGGALLPAVAVEAATRMEMVADRREQQRRTHPRCAAVARAEQAGAAVVRAATAVVSFCWSPAIRSRSMERSMSPVPEVPGPRQAT